MTQTKDITDRMVCDAVFRSFHYMADEKRNALDILVDETGAAEKVCFRAIERSLQHRLVDCGVSIRTCWLTAAGYRKLDE